MKFDKPKFKPHSSPGFIIHKLDSYLKLGLYRAFQAKGLDFTAEQWGVLFRLYDCEGVHQSELGVRSGKDRHNITRILNILEKKGFIRRVLDKADKRRYNIYLTRKSLEIKEKLTSTVLDFLEEAFTGLTKKDIIAMKRMHEHIIKNVDDLLSRIG